MSPWRCRAAFGAPPLPEVDSIKAASPDEVPAGESVSLADAIQLFHIAHDTPWVSTLPSATTTIGICGRSPEEGKNAASASDSTMAARRSLLPRQSMKP